MRSTRNPMGMGIIEGSEMIRDGITGLVACDVKSDNMPVPELFHQPYRRHTFFAGKMPQGAEDNADGNAGLFDPFIDRAVDRGDDLFRRKPFFAVLQGRETDLG